MAAQSLSFITFGDLDAVFRDRPLHIHANAAPTDERDIKTLIGHDELWTV